MKIKFNTIGLFTKNQPAMVAFYRDLFEFKTDWDGQSSNVEMESGDMRLIMYPREQFEQMTSRKYGYPEGLNGTLELAFDVENYAAVDVTYPQAIEMGATSVFQPTTEPWGQRTCYIADPDGNLIEISSFVK